MSNLPPSVRSRAAAITGGISRVKLAHWAKLIPTIEGYEPELMKLSDYELKKRSLSLRYRVRSGESLGRLMPEAYALVREAGRRTLNMRHFDVQILGGIAMFHRSIVEMQTGEGKTLTATLPMYLHALEGFGAHLATVNDYLARRDAEWMSPIYKALGLSVGIVEAQMPQPKRREAYACDVTYGTAKEFGFDFLRDRLLLRRIQEGQTDLLGGMMATGSKGSSEKPVQREAHFSLVDEADSILIDEARTPLIISALPTEDEKLQVACYEWSSQMAEEFVEDEDYEYDHDKRTVELTRSGRLKVRTLPKPEAMDREGIVNIYRFVERAIMVQREYTLDRQFVVRDGEIVIVDEFTGAPGRRPQMARRHPPGGRGDGRSGGDRLDGAGGADYGAGLLPPLRQTGRHDRYGHRVREGTAEDIQMQRHPGPDEPARYSPAAARPGLWDHGREVGRDRGRNRRNARAGTARPHRNPVHRQVGASLQAPRRARHQAPGP